jgi:REP element-mobilizing transposase RayT
MTQRRIYQEEYPYFVTFRIRDNYPLFEDDKMAELLANEIIVSSYIKKYDILAYQIMPEHVHLLVYNNTDRRYLKNDRTLESVRSGTVNNGRSTSTERTFSKVRSDILKQQFTISDLMQSIKGNFSRKIHMGNIWQKRFYTRIVNNRRYLRTVIGYIKHNPIKAKLSNKYYNPPYRYFDWSKINGLF